MVYITLAKYSTMYSVCMYIYTCNYGILVPVYDMHYTRTESIFQGSLFCMKVNDSSVHLQGFILQPPLVIKTTKFGPMDGLKMERQLYSASRKWHLVVTG